MPVLPIIDGIEITGLGGTARTNQVGNMKLEYMDSWGRWLNTEAAPILSVMNRDAGMMKGQLSIGNVITQIPSSAGIPVHEGWKLPSAYSASYKNPRIVSRAQILAKLQWTEEVLEAASGGESSWVSAKSDELEGARLRSALNEQRQAYQGYFDVLTTTKSYADAASPNGTFTLYDINDRTSGVTTPGNRYKLGNFYLHADQAFAWVLNAAGIKGRTANSLNTAVHTYESKIASISDSDPTTPTFTATYGAGSTQTDFDDIITNGYNNVDPAVGDFVIVYGTRQHAAVPSDATQDAYYATMNGLESFILGTAHYDTVMGLMKSSVAQLSGLHSTNAETQRAFSWKLVNVLRDRARVTGVGESITHLFLNESVLREVVSEDLPNQRFTENVLSGKGFQSMGHITGDGRAPYVSDWYCAPGQVFGVRDKDMLYYTRTPVTTLPQRFVPDYMQQQTIVWKAGNRACKHPASQFCLDDLVSDYRSAT